jgi:excisionase family DNA binding protein
MKPTGISIRASLPSDKGEPVAGSKEEPWKPMPTIIGAGDMYTPDPNIWITATEAAKRYGLPTSTIRQWIRNRQIRATMGDHGNRENVWYVSIEHLMRKI